MAYNRKSNQSFGLLVIMGAHRFCTPKVGVQFSSGPPNFSSLKIRTFINKLRFLGDDMTSKVCSTCKVDKPLTEFYRAKSKPGGHAYNCKACSDGANKKTRDKHTKRYLGYRNDYKLKLTEMVNEYKSARGCACCGENSHPHVLDLHHLDPSEKEGSPSLLRTSWERWLTEAQKCVILCANCHRKVHAGILKILPD